MSKVLESVKGFGFCHRGKVTCDLDAQIGTSMATNHRLGVPISRFRPESVSCSNGLMFKK